MIPKSRKYLRMSNKSSTFAADKSSVYVFVLNELRTFDLLVF